MSRSYPVGSGGLNGGQAPVGSRLSQPIGQQLGNAQPEHTWQNSARAGAFGADQQKKINNLDGRQALFSAMKGPWNNASMDKFRETGRKLGVNDAGWAAGVSRANGQEPAAPAPPKAIPVPETSTPQFGSDIAKNNIATKGLAGAIADYKARSAAAPGIPMASDMPKDTMPARSWQQQATTPAPINPAIPAPAPIPAPSPVAAQITTPSIAPPPTAMPAPGNLTDANPVTFYGPGGYRSPQNVADATKIAADNQAKATREEDNRKRQSIPSTTRPLLDRTVGKKPGWMEGTGAGKAWDLVNK